jgi:hypothetical protein
MNLPAKLLVDKKEYYPDPVVLDKSVTIFVRFDGSQSPGAFNVPIYFPNDDVLRGKVITGLEVNTQYASIGTRPSAILTNLGFIGALFTNAELKYFTITLVGKNNDILVNDCPLIAFNSLLTNGKLRSLLMMIDLSKSYVRNFGLAGLTTKSTIMCTFYYREKK